MKWERLIEARSHAGLTQTKLGKLLGVTKNTVLRWEALLNYPDLYQIKEIACITHCSLDWLLYNDPFVLQSKQHMDDVYDLATAVILWKRENGEDVYPEKCSPKNNAGLVRYFSMMTNRKEVVEWSEVKAAMEGIIQGENDPIFNCDAAMAKRKRAKAKQQSVQKTASKKTQK